MAQVALMLVHAMLLLFTVVSAAVLASSSQNLGLHITHRSPGDTTITISDPQAPLTPCELVTFNWVIDSGTRPPPKTFILTVESLDDPTIGERNISANTVDLACNWTVMVPPGTYQLFGTAGSKQIGQPVHFEVQPGTNASCTLSATPSNGASFSSSPLPTAAAATSSSAAPSVVQTRLLNGGAIAGIAIGCTGAIALVAGGIYITRRRRHTAPGTRSLESDASPPITRSSSSAGLLREHSIIDTLSRAASPALDMMMRNSHNRPLVAHTDMEPEKLQQVLRGLKS